jgi:DNA polymerase-3 subunit delta'
MSAEEAGVLLKSAGGRPDEVLRQKDLGQSQQWWSQFPRAMLVGNASFCSELPPSEVIDALQKLCHDLMMVRIDAETRFFNASDLPPLKVSSPHLSAWFKRLSKASRSSEHPFNVGLMLEALCTEAREVMNSPA